jgi:hypothetical protein
LRSPHETLDAFEKRGIDVTDLREDVRNLAR